VEGSTFSALVALVFGAFSWLQLPALCGFIFDSTRAGAGNYRYSIILGAILALVGCVSGMHAYIRGSRGALAIAAAVLNLSFFATAVAAPGLFDGICRASYIDMRIEP